MPHIVIEHSSTLTEKVDLQLLANSLHQELSQQETVKLEAVKTRTIEVKNIIMGAGKQNNFLHVTVKLLSGRNVVLKEKMAQALFDRISILTSELSDLRVSIEVVDLGVYLKN